jgi:GNAT superfamily N-acetyltransferase
MKILKILKKNPMKTRALSKADYTSWRILWDQYLIFYKHELAENQTQLTFDRLINASFEMHGLVLEVDGQILGIAHVSFRPSTWADNKELYLEDLFVDPSVRGKGYGRALIESAKELGKLHGAKKLSWQTHRDNLTAQRLYDSMAVKSEFITYETEI